MADEEPFDCVRLMRDIREQIGREMDGMTFEEQRRWIEEQLAKPSVTQDTYADNAREHG